MTDKELRRLSRLELLELLLKESKENEKLKTELNRLKLENELAEITQQLKTAANQIDLSLQNANSLSEALQKLLYSESSNTSYEPVNKKNNAVSNKTDSTNAPKENNGTADINIYKRLMIFFNRNSDYLSGLPEDLRTDISIRIKELSSRK